jgi:hypothetical protein
MPCRGGPTNEELAFDAAMKDPIFAAEQRRIWKEEDERMRAHLKIIEEEERRIWEDELVNHTLEKIAFGSFMTVFMCRLMQIVVSNYGYKFLPEEFEWWWHEHGWRDTHNDQTIKSPEELAKKLIEINNKYKVLPICHYRPSTPFTESEIKKDSNPQREEDVNNTDNKLLDKIE